VLDILQNCQGNQIEARKQILILFGQNNDQLKQNNIDSNKGDSWNEIPQIDELDKEFNKKQKHSRVDYPIQKESFDNNHRDQTTEHIQAFLCGQNNERTKNFSLTEKDPPITIKKSKRKNKKKRKNKRKFYKVATDSEEELIYDKVKKSNKGTSIQETLSNETRESMSKKIDEFTSDFSSLNFSRILDDIEGPEMTPIEKEELLQIMKNDYKDSWDEHDQKSFMDAYLDAQMVEDMVKIKIN
jgi:hypothetical protein